MSLSVLGVRWYDCYMRTSLEIMIESGEMCSAWRGKLYSGILKLKFDLPCTHV